MQNPLPPELQTSDHWEFGATWSPDGASLAFLSNQTGNNEIHVMPAGGGEAVVVTSTAGNLSPAVWSPDGATLLYNLNTGSTDLWTMEVASILANE